MNNRPMTDKEILQWLETNKETLSPARLLQMAYLQSSLRNIEDKDKMETDKSATEQAKEVNRDYQESPLRLLIRGYVEKDEARKVKEEDGDGR